MGFEGRVLAVAGILVTVFAVQAIAKDVKTLYTRGYYYSQFFPLEENLAEDRTLRFSVRTPRDAHILLSPSHQADGPVYEVVLGARNNTINYIRGRCPCQEEPSATIRTVNLLSGEEFRDFWIRINSDGRRTFVQVGIGASETPFHEWRDPRPLNPQFLSFRSGSTAEWRYGYKDDTYTTGVSKDKRQSVVASIQYGQFYPLSEVVSHSEDAITLYFTVRTSQEFLILFSPGVSYLGGVYEFGLRENGAYVRRQRTAENKASYNQEGFLSNQDQRVPYWIKLTKDGQVMLGRGGSLDPLLTWQDPEPISPQYLSFALYRERGEEIIAGTSADVQFALGPDYTLTSQDCRPRWKDGSASIPPGAVRGGYTDNEELFVCRATHDTDVLPGSLFPGKNGRGECHVSVGFAVYPKTDFQALTGCRLKWVKESLGRIPDGAIWTGEIAQNVKVYVSRVPHNNQVIIGKLIPTHRLTYIPFMKQELPYTSYEVLVNPMYRADSGTGGQSNNPPPLIGK